MQPMMKIASKSRFPLSDTLWYSVIVWFNLFLYCSNGLSMRQDMKRSTSLSHWARVTHICVGNLTIIGSDNALSPGRRQPIIQTNAGILSIGPLGTNFNEISIGILTFSFTKMRLKVLSAKCGPFCLGLNVLFTTHHQGQESCVHNAYMQHQAEIV